MQDPLVQRMFIPRSACPREGACHSSTWGGRGADLVWLASCAFHGSLGCAAQLIIEDAQVFYDIWLKPVSQREVSGENCEGSG